MGATHLGEVCSSVAAGNSVVLLGYPSALCMMTVPTLLATRIVYRLLQR